MEYFVNYAHIIIVQDKIIYRRTRFIMRTQYEKNSIYIASASYRGRERTKKLRAELIVFFSALSIICAGLYIIISSIPY